MQRSRAGTKFLIPRLGACLSATEIPVILPLCLSTCGNSLQRNSVSFLDHKSNCWGGGRSCLLLVQCRGGCLLFFSSVFFFLGFLFPLFELRPPTRPPHLTSDRPPPSFVFPAKRRRREMSTPKLLAQTLPSLRLAPRRTAGSIARHAPCYTRSSAGPLPAGPSRVPLGVRRSPWWPTAFQSRPFSASAAVSHGHVHPPKPGEEYGPLVTPLHPLRG